MSRLKLLLAALMLCGPALAEGLPRANFVVPEQSILGAEKEYEPGRIVKLKVTAPVKSPEHLASSSYAWRAYEYDQKTGDLAEVEDTIDIPGGVAFGSGLKAKRVKVVCVCTHLYIVRDKEQVREVGTRTAVLSCTVRVGGLPGPQPGPQPGPDPQPEPLGLEKLANEAATRVPEASRAKGAAALTASFRGVASAIRAGTIRDLKSGLLQARESNNRALDDSGVKRSDWEGFGLEIQEALYQAYLAKKLKTAPDLAAACEEVAAGLGRVR